MTGAESQPRVLGVAASLRNARWGAGNAALLDDLRGLSDEPALRAYLHEQGTLHLQQFVDAGREEGLPFDAIYAQLKKLTGKKGLSNSEVALAAGLWAVAQAGAEIDHLSLAEHFPPSGDPRDIAGLKTKLLAADAVLVSGPVYFGDRGSLAQELIDLVRSDAELQEGLAGKVYGGIAVGAKRNGGQETTLIYQLLDLVSAGMLGVGNDSDTTSQYGGTACAGDVGAMSADDYGIWTCLGVGRRVAHSAALLKAGRAQPLRSRIKVAFWILQDREGRARALADELAALGGEGVEARVHDLTESAISRCIACDICPTHVDVDERYRCIIKSKRDAMPDLHEQLLYPDAIVPIVYSSTGRTASVYQRFIERTRYLRRGDYVFSDAVVSPLVLEDIGAQHNMTMRAVTSLMRHNTIISRPLTLLAQGDTVLNRDALTPWFEELLQRTRVATGGRLLAFRDGTLPGNTRYNPVGYVLSAEKTREDVKLQQRANMIEQRHARLSADAEARLGS